LRLLLDANALFWVLNKDGRVPPDVFALIKSTDNDVGVGLGAVWELLAKRSAGRLGFVGDPIEAARQSRFAIVPILAEHVVLSTELPRHHGDPFDRLIVAQALIEQRVLVTSDRVIAAYPVETILL
jgi:PIN domain nuclease of toxin-antitoxin system